MGQAERNKGSTWIQASLYASDILAIGCGVVFGYWARFHSPLVQLLPPEKGVPPLQMYLLAAGATVLLWIPLFQTLGLYRSERGRARHRRADLARGLVLGALAIATVAFFYRGASFSRVAMVMTWCGTAVFLLAGRTLVQSMMPRWTKLRPMRFALVGTGPLAVRVRDSLSGSSFPHEFQGCFVYGGSRSPERTSAPESSAKAAFASRLPARATIAIGSPMGSTRASGAPGSAVASSASGGSAFAPGAPAASIAGSPVHRAVPDEVGMPILGTIEEIGARAEELDLDLVVMTSAERIDEVYAQCQPLDVDVQLVPEILSMWTRRVRFEEVDGLPLLRLRDLPLVGWNGVMKRTLDLVVSGLLLILLSPLFLGIAITVRMDSPGPVFHRQDRVGRDRRHFTMLKFRSMRVDAESQTGPVWARENDPRRTRVGAFLRKWSLDELPQLWNVFRGEMSLVGPRPERPVFVEQFEQRVHDYYDRHRVKSGVTGWAQVHGLRGNVPIEERTRYDLYYVENWSLWLDLRILWLTLSAVLLHRGE